MSEIIKPIGPRLIVRKIGDKRLDESKIEIPTAAKRKAKKMGNYAYILRVSDELSAMNKYHEGQKVLINATQCVPIEQEGDDIKEDDVIIMIPVGGVLGVCEEGEWPSHGAV